MEEAKLLGKKVEYPGEYCPEILVTVPRSLNREQYGIRQPEQLFCGYDAWHAYEVSFILNSGLPVAGILKMVYPSSSRCIIESKSLKLYFGSFNMTRMGSNREEGIRKFESVVATDLSRTLETDVRVCFFSTIAEKQPFDFGDYQLLEDHIDSGTEVSAYQECPDLLKENIIFGEGEIKWGSHLLKSNCKITHQPDWGSIYIHLKGKSVPDRASLLRYIVSLRNENHFHEEICEMTYKRLTDIFRPDTLSVCCLYTRRGGIDICPVRVSAPELLPEFLIRPGLLTRPGFRQ